MLNAAFEEFAKEGYNKASTNNIVKEAGIGKGMLFYYFNSKKELFDYLIEYGSKFVITEYLDKIHEGQSDFIEKYAQVGKIKKEAYTKNPHIFNFFGTIYINKDKFEMSQELKNKLDYVRDSGFKKLYDNIDASLFREDVEPQEVIKLIQWTMDGYEKELVSKLDGKELQDVDMEPYWEDFYRFLEVLKRIFYK
nr:TetR/AcrR family transcriptional regulator [Alkalicella caledoniensis]